MSEADRRQAKLDQIERALQADTSFVTEWATGLEHREVRRGEALAILEDLQQGLDASEFRERMQEWAPKPGYSAFNGFNGQMFVNQLVNYTDGARSTAELLADVLTVPADEADAARKLRALLGLVESIKKGAHPAPGRVPFVLSLFWSLQEPDEWPALWQSAEQVSKDLGWLVSSPDIDQAYLTFREVILSFRQSPIEVEKLLYWVAQTKPFTGLDPALLERCRENAELGARRAEFGDAYETPDAARTAALNARCILGELKLAGAALESRVDNALGRDVSPRLAQLKRGDDHFRADGYVAWSLEKSGNLPGFWLWVTAGGVAIGLHPGWRDAGWTDRIGRELSGTLPEGVEFLKVRNRPDLSIEASGTEIDGGTFLVGEWLPGADALDRLSLANDVERVAAKVQPVFDRVLRIAQGETDVPDDPINALVKRFRAAYSYPTEKDKASLADRDLFAATLVPEALEGFDVDTFRQIINSGRYGGPGPQAILNATIKGAGPDELSRLASAIDYLLWNEDDPLAARIDRVLDPGQLGVRGLGESVTMKLLAIAHPTVVLPVFPYASPHGKQPMLEQLGLPALDDKALTRGEVQVAANDAIRERLRAFFPDDLWEMGRFLWWMHGAAITDENEIEIKDPIDPLEALAEDLLVDREFLDDVVALLEEKRQVVFYGPPGTGKTYIAKALAKALVADQTRRAIVQFHPSTSYEDFFEGYRPESDDSGQLSYSLVKGPLARMAEQAAASPNVRHVMVVDEINRANLPKVFGELLFLLEYRDEAIHTLYRPEETFELPDNLWFIGTMNSADRSIALVDAALRRRFHFVPFFPEQDHMVGLLGKWLGKHKGDVRIARLVEQVNQELVEQIGEHLQIGPSYFMREGLDDEQLRRIWKYSIAPYIEEQLFGQRSEIAHYQYDEVRNRYWNTLKSPNGVLADGVDTEVDQATPGPITE